MQGTGWVLAVGMEAFEGAESLWRELESQRDVSPFQRFAWTRTWFDTMGSDCEPWLLIREGPAPALLPLALRRRNGLRILELAGQGPSDYLGPLPQRLEASTGREMALCLSTAARHFDLLQAQSWTSSEELLQGWIDSLPGRPISRIYEPCPSIETVGTWDEYLRGRTKKFRANLKRTARQADQLGSLEIAREPVDEALFEELVAVERDSWKWENGFAFLRDAQLRAFLRSVLLGGKVPLELWTARAPGELAAFALVFLSETTRYYYLPSFRSRYPDVGTQLMRVIIEDCFESPFEEFDFLQGDERYKRPWATQQRVVHEVVTSATPQGAAGLALMRLRWRLARSERAQHLRERALLELQRLRRVLGGSS